MLHVNQLIGFGAGGGSGELQFVGYKTGTYDGTSGSIATTGLTGGIDTQARQGDILVLGWGYGDTADGSESASGTLTWTTVANVYANDDNDANLFVSWAYANVAPPATITFGTGFYNKAAAILMVFRPANAASPLDATTTTATGINSNTPNPPSITPVTSGAIVLVFGLAAKPSGDTKSVTAAPAGYTGFAAVDLNPSSNKGVLIGAAYKSTGITAGVAEDPGAFTVSATAITNSWAAATLALRPA